MKAGEKQTPIAEPLDPFQRELFRQLTWLTANISELNDGVAVLADGIRREQDRARRECEGGRS